VVVLAVSNRVRAAVWVSMLAGGYLASRALDTLLGWGCCTYCIPAGLALLALIGWTSMVTSRYLATYGKSSLKGFGELDRLVTEGPYSCMRHPMHSMLAFTPIALGLVTASPSYVLLVGPALYALIMVLAVRVDEAESVERFGEDYLRYREVVPAINLSVSSTVSLYVLVSL